MTLYIDASAIVAMIAREPEASSFAEVVSRTPERATCAIAVWESVRAVARVRSVSWSEARSLVADFLRDADIRPVAIDATEAELALDAHASFGKGVHKAELNMGDCFTYACAIPLKANILFKGEDLVHTDLRDATLT